MAETHTLKVSDMPCQHHGLRADLPRPHKDAIRCPKCKAWLISLHGEMYYG